MLARLGRLDSGARLNAQLCLKGLTVAGVRSVDVRSRGAIVIGLRAGVGGARFVRRSVRRNKADQSQDDRHQSDFDS
jgi:hypothetical protein